MSEQAGGVRADDPSGGRRPTSHERRAGERWDASYVDGPAPWDIGRPQPAILRLSSEGAFAGAVLDAGCGTGEHALLIASLGLRVVGVDVAETALSLAREKAADRGIDADFVLADALRLDRLGRVFETVLDCRPPSLCGSSEVCFGAHPRRLWDSRWSWARSLLLRVRGERTR